MSIQEQKLEFILFLDPTDGNFYSYCASKGLLAKEESAPYKIKDEASKQMEDLKICL
jgi:hypothetical protein